MAPYKEENLYTMANKTITMLQIRRIIQLKSKGKSNREIAWDLHAARNTVNGYVRQITGLAKSLEELLALNDQELSSLICKEPVAIKKDWRYGDLQERIPGFYDELKKPHVTRMTLWEEYHERVPEGYGYTQFCEHLNRYLQVKQAVMHFEHEPAASLMFDYAGSKIPFTDLQTGEINYCPVLVCTLPFSDYTYLEASLSAKREQMLHTLNQSFHYFGGVPHSVKTDNMKQVVKKSDRYEPSFDELAQQWSLHYGTTLMAARIKKPRDKASVESHVNAVYNRIYARLRNRVFHSVQEINDALWEELERFNSRNFQRCDYSRRDRFLLHEKPLLQALPLEPFIPKNKVVAKVQRNYHITLGQDWHHYSVPCQYIGKTVQIIYDTEHVEVYLDMIRIAWHKRNYHRNGYTTLEEHMPAHHRYYTRSKGWNREYFIEKATPVGVHTTTAVTRILDQKIFIEQTYNSCLGVFRLGEKYGPERLEAACRRALAGYKVTYTVIKNILEHNLDRAASHQDFVISIPEHENIRGAESYQ